MQPRAAPGDPHVQSLRRPQQVPPQAEGSPWFSRNERNPAVGSQYSRAGWWPGAHLVQTPSFYIQTGRPGSPMPPGAPSPARRWSSAPGQHRAAASRRGWAVRASRSWRPGCGRGCGMRRGCPGGEPPGHPDPRRAGALTGGVVEVQGHLLVAHRDAGRVLLEHGWGVLLSEKGQGWSPGARRGSGVRWAPHLPPSPHPARSPPPTPPRTHTARRRNSRGGARGGGRLWARRTPGT